LLDAATRRLATRGSESARLEAELLLGKVTAWSRAEVLAHPERAIPSTMASAFDALVLRRLAAEPIAYLLGEREFYGRMFRVDARALIPRPETELLVDLGRAAIERWRGRGVTPRVVDVGTGCGAVAVSVATECDVPVIATDVSMAALSLAHENARQHRAPLRLLRSDLLRGLRGPLHVILANLPYVPDARALPRDVGGYEPRIALFGGEQGTELIERLLHEARPLLPPSGELAVELDEEEQAVPVAALSQQLYPSAEVTICHDHGGYDRVVRVIVG
jgi:release factor glutamine methyltransferase